MPTPNWAGLSHTTELAFMSRRLDYGHDFHKRQAAIRLECERRSQNDAAARWLRRNGYHASQKSDHRASAQQPAFSEGKVHPAKTLQHRHADLDPCDPHDQLDSYLGDDMADLVVFQSGFSRRISR